MSPVYLSSLKKLRLKGSKQILSFSAFCQIEILIFKQQGLMHFALFLNWDFSV